MKSMIACLLIAFICGTYAVSEVYEYDEGDFTMLEQMDLSLDVPYNKTGGSAGSVKLTVENATVNEAASSLNSSYAVLVLNFGELSIHNLTQVFKSDGKSFWLEEIEFNIFLDKEIFEKAMNDTATFTLTSKDMFKTSFGRSYACDALVTEQITDVKPEFNMTFSNMKVQPFGVENKQFSTGEHCPQDPSTQGPTTQKSTTSSKTTSHTTPGTTEVKTTSNATTQATTTSNTTTGTTVNTTTATPKPTPKPATGPFNFNFTDSKGKSCILEQMKASFAVAYNHNGTKGSVFINMTDAKLDPIQSHCGDRSKNKSAVLSVFFGPLQASTMKQEFAVKGNQSSYLQRLSLSLIGITIDKESKNVTADIVMTDTNSTFQIPFEQSLKCDSNITTEGKDGSEFNVTVSFTNVKLQAFDIKNSNYSKESVCAPDRAISNIVPIAVGCALAVLVIIVLVAYLIGRRNSSRAGYESV